MDCAAFDIFVASCRDDDALLTVHCSRVAVRCNNITFVANEPWFLGTCRRRHLLELPPALVPMMSPAPRAVPLSPLLPQVQNQRERLQVS
jgi:hypothetical protein